MLVCGEMLNITMSCCFFWVNDASVRGGTLLSVALFCNAFLNIITCCLCNNTHILCLLSDVTSYTDSVASHSQSGYPNRKVHVFPFLKKKKLVYKRRKKSHPIMTPSI